jgi:hypothetical protein
MNFLPKISKNKKTFFVVFLFLVVVATAVPHVAFAWSWPWNWAADAVVAGTINAFIAIAFAIPLFIVSIAATISKLLLGIVLSVALNASYTNTTSVNVGWPIVRDLGNMMIVLGFVVIGIATALRIREYEAKQLLVKLIIAALLINFSLLICGMFIDATNIIMRFFFDTAGPGGGWITPLLDITDLIGNIGANSPLVFGSVLVGMMFFYFIEFFVDLLYALLIICRMVAISMLVILSPLAFVCYVFPATKKIWSMWWDNFFQWCIIVLPAGLFYYIGEKMISMQNNNTVATTAQIIKGGLASYIKTNMDLILIPGLFLIVGFFVSLKFAPMGAGAIMNFANKNKGKILGGGLAALQKGSGAAGAKLQQWGKAGMGSTSRIGQGAGFLAATAGGVASFAGKSTERTKQAKSWLGRMGEKAGAIPISATAAADAKEVKEKAEQIKFEYDRAKLNNDRPTIERIRQDAMTGQGVKGAASYKVVSDAKDLHETFADPITGQMTPDGERALYERGKFAEEHGAQGIIKDNEKLNPAYRKYNEYELEEKGKKTFPGVAPSAWTAAQRAQLEKEVVAEGFQKAGPSEIKNYHKSVLGSKEFIENVRGKALERSANTELTQEQATALKGHIPHLQSEMKKCLQPNSNILLPGMKERYDELDQKLKVASTA